MFVLLDLGDVVRGRMLFLDGHQSTIYLLRVTVAASSNIGEIENVAGINRR
jgi:hypothetical protein